MLKRPPDTVQHQPCRAFQQPPAAPPEQQPDAMADFSMQVSKSFGAMANAAREACVQHFVAVLLQWTRHLDSMLAQVSSAAQHDCDTNLVLEFVGVSG